VTDINEQTTTWTDTSDIHRITSKLALFNTNNNKTIYNKHIVMIHESEAWHYVAKILLCKLYIT